MMPGEEHEVRRVEDAAVGERDHRAPLGVGRLHAETEEAEAGDLDHGGGEAERRLHDERRQRVREHAVQQDSPCSSRRGRGRR